jgi:hypothetical protein
MQGVGAIFHIAPFREPPGAAVREDTATARKKFRIPARTLGPGWPVH